MKFTELGLTDVLLEALDCMGFEKATPIQEEAIPKILDGKDVLAFAQTGTGKTAAFILPILNILSQQENTNTSTLVIVPTRELALQVEQQIQGFAYFAGISSIAVYGGGSGMDWEVQKKALTEGADIIVATPGKLISFLNGGHVAADKIKYLILDEADRMLDIGFKEDILNVIKKLTNLKQRLLFSATMAPKIKSFASSIMNDPYKITLGISKPAAGVLQAAYLVYESQKNALINKLIADKPAYKSIIIFSSTKKKVSDIVRALRRKNPNVEGISSDLDQQQREQVLRNFRAKNLRILVGTDVISRGIDIKDINLVINYDVPNDPEDYVHRVGRTARADTTGVAITLIHEEDMYKFKHIENLIESEVPKVALPEGFEKGPEWNPSKPKQKGRFGGNRRHSGGGKSNNRNRGGRNSKRSNKSRSPRN